jgi:hypothetical protein
MENEHVVSGLTRKGLAAECARLADIMEEEATAKESDDVQPIGEARQV